MRCSVVHPLVRGSCVRPKNPNATMLVAAGIASAINRLGLLEFDIMQRYAEKLDRAVISGERQTLAGDFVAAAEEHFLEQPLL